MQPTRRVTHPFRVLCEQGGIPCSPHAIRKIGPTAQKRRVTYCTRTSPLPLLPSGPGGVGGITSRRTRHLLILAPKAGPSAVSVEGWIDRRRPSRGRTIRRELGRQFTASARPLGSIASAEISLPDYPQLAHRNLCNRSTGPASEQNRPDRGESLCNDRLGFSLNMQRKTPRAP